MFLAFAVTTYVITVFSLTGNTLVLLSIVNSRRLHTTSNVYVCALAVVDMFICSLHSVKYTLVLLDIRINHYWGSSLMALSLFGIVSNLMMIEAISMDRFLAIYWPFRYRIVCTKSRAVKASVFFVFVSLVIVVGAIVVFMPKRDTNALYYWEDVFSMPIAVGMTIVTYGVTLELFVLYGAMWYKAVTHKKSSLIRHSGKDTNVFDIKAFKTCSVVLGAFLLMWSPPLIVMNIATRSQDPTYFRYSLAVCLMLPAVNSLVDPIVYAIMQSDIRKGIRRLFWKRNKRKYVCK